MGFKEQIAEVLEPAAGKAAGALGLWPLRIHVRGTEQTPVIEVIIDGEREVTLEDCATVSRALNAFIEANKAIKGNFRLDVLSPGVDEPLTRDYQFRRNLDRLLRVETSEEFGSKTIIGRIRSIEGDQLALDVQSGSGKSQHTESLSLPLNAIKRAVVQVEFNRSKPDKA